MKFLLIIIIFYIYCDEIVLKSRTINTDDFKNHRRTLDDSVGIMILQSKGLLNVEEKKKVIDYLELSDVGLKWMLPNYSYLVKGVKSTIFNKGKEMTELIKFIDVFFDNDKTLLDFSSIVEVKREIVLSVMLHSGDDEFNNLPPLCEYELIDKFFIHVYIKGNAVECLEYFKKHPDVFWIERDIDIEVKNFVSNKVIQSGLKGNDNEFLWKQGINGTGELIHIGDTGIDWTNCFFFDPVGAPAILEDGPASGTLPLNHRKLFYYRVKTVSTDIDNGVDEINGHGTHISASAVGHIVGSSSDKKSLEKYNGVAKGARLYFTDLKDGDKLTPPSGNMLFDYFMRPHDRGVFIHSISWGCSVSSIVDCDFNCKCKWNENNFGYEVGKVATNAECQKHYQSIKTCCQVCNYYSAKAYFIDKYTYEKIDGVVTVAAGNEGHITISSSLTSPGTTKNGITVGSTYSDIDGMKDNLNRTDTDILCGVGSEIAGITISSTEQCCDYVNVLDKKIEKKVRETCCLTTIEELYEKNKADHSTNNLAFFSSRGPTQNGMTKPDVVVPGFINSAHSDGTLRDSHTEYCGTQRSKSDNKAGVEGFQGTSMSTPIVAGGLALIRQQVKKKFKISNPTGILLKAIMLHSTRSITGYYVRGDKRKISLSNKYPSSEQGFGVPELNTVICNDCDIHLIDRQALTMNFTRIVKDRDTIPLMKKVYCFEKLEDGPVDLRATLVWYDYPSIPVTAASLIEDIDLYACKGALCWAGNNNINFDRKNTVEQIRGIPFNKKGEVISIAVRVHMVINPPIMYSLVVTGTNIARIYTGCNVTDTPNFIHFDVFAFLLISGGGFIVVIILIAIIGVGGYFIYKYRDEIKEKFSKNSNEKYNIDNNYKSREMREEEEDNYRNRGGYVKRPNPNIKRYYDEDDY